MFRGARRAVLAGVLRGLVIIGWHKRAAAIAYRRRARALARDARARMRRWGVPFELDLNDNVQRTFYYTRWYEREFLQFLERELRPNDTYVDVGAHVGIDAAFAARLLPEGSVVAFEPAKDAAERLRESTRQLANVEVVCAALGAENGTTTLRTNPKWHDDDVATWSRFGAGVPACTAKLLRFDDWAGDLERMDVVKIDVEGSELDVLNGMHRALERFRPRLLSVELYRPHLAAAGTSRREIVDYLAERGYEHDVTIGDNAIFRLSGSAGATPPKAAERARRGRLKPVAVPGAIVAAAVAVWMARAAVVSDYSSGAARLAGGAWWPVVLLCLVAVWLLSAGALRLAGETSKARAIAGFVPDVAVLVARLLLDERLPRRAKCVLALFAVYLAAPVDLVPDVIPVLGLLDEALLAGVVLRWVARSSGASLLQELWPGPEASLRLVLRVAAA